MSQENTKSDKKTTMIPNQPKPPSGAPITEQQKASWEQIKIAAKQSWGSLTDEDFNKAGGSMDRLCGVIHDRFGDSSESIKAVLINKMSNRPMSTKNPTPAVPHK